MHGKGNRKTGKPPSECAQPEGAKEYAKKTPEPWSLTAARGDAARGILNSSLGRFLIDVFEPSELRGGSVISGRIDPKTSPRPKCNSILHHLNVGR